MSTADPSDVDPGVISTDLDNTAIQSFLDDAEFEARRAINQYDEWDSERKTQLEKYLAALRIRQVADKGISSASRETGASPTREVLFRRCASRSTGEIPAGRSRR